MFVGLTGIEGFRGAAHRNEKWNYRCFLTRWIASDDLIYIRGVPGNGK